MFFCISGFNLCMFTHVYINPLTCIRTLVHAYIFKGIGWIFSFFLSLSFTSNLFFYQEISLFFYSLFSLTLSLSLYIYIYISLERWTHTHTHTHTHTYIYIYIYIHLCIHTHIFSRALGGCNAWECIWPHTETCF